MSGCGSMSEAMKGKLGLGTSVAYVSRGFRDVYWCPYLNEPVILTYSLATDTPWCTGCDSELDSEHTFICTVSKP
jgi:hypothetical protein